MLVAGVDEVGRGPLAGAVVAAAVILDPNNPIEGLTDSKKLTEKKRDLLFDEIKQKALSWAIGRAEVEEIDEDTALCKRSYWIYSDTGGIMAVHPKVTDLVKKGEVIATLRNIFGDVVKEYQAPEDGIVIGKSANPVGQTGSRILHFGTIAEAGEQPFLPRTDKTKANK